MGEESVIVTDCMDYLRVVVEVNIDDGGGYTNYSRKQST